MKIIPGLLTVSILVFSFPVFAKDPDCNGPEQWPTSIAFGEIMDIGLIHRDTLDFDKTSSVRLASEKIGKDPTFNKDLYRQVHLVTFVHKSGKTVSAITVNDASHVECSMSGVDVYVISKHLGAAQEKQ